MKFKTLLRTGIIALAGIVNAHSQDSMWAKHIIDDSINGADGVRIEDVNGDSLMDVTTGFEEGGVSMVYIHPGYEKVKEKWPGVKAGDTPAVEDAVFADLDGDGAFDVISSTERQSMKMFVNWAPKQPEDYLDSTKWTTEAFPASEGFTRWMFSIPIQLDGKNGIDIIAGSKLKDCPLGVIGWFEAPADPRIVADWKWHAIYPAEWVMSLILRDMDGDGDLDVVTSDRIGEGTTRGVRWMENPGTGPDQIKEWKNHFIGAQNVTVMFMDMADLDGDGHEDAIATERSNQNIIFFRRLDETGLNWESHMINLPPESGLAKAVRIGDINGDGVLDIVHSSNTNSEPKGFGLIWLSSASGNTCSNWTWHPVSEPGGGIFDRMELLDLDGDGDLDILTADQGNYSGTGGNGVVWYENP